MKRIKRLLFFTAGLCMLIACSKSDDFPGDDPFGNQKGGHNNLVSVSIPFKADFSVWDKSDYSDVSCGGFPVLFLTMEGNGTATHLGKLTTRMTFCCNVQTGYYYNTVGSFVAANGDELYISVPVGYIIPNEGEKSEYYQTRFDDPIFFVGGTGRFEGATGSGTTKAFVHDGTDEWRTDFFTTGNLVLTKGKQ